MAEAAVSVSAEVLRDSGPLTLREVTRLTAKRINANQFYVNVDAVLTGEERRGRVRIKQEDWFDYRNTVWEWCGDG